MDQEALVKIIVVSAAQLDGVGRIADLANVHETSRIQDGQFEITFIEFFHPLAPVGHAKVLAAKIVGRDRTVPAVVRRQREIQHGVAPAAVAGGHVLDNFFVGLAHVAVGVDDPRCLGFHSASTKSF